MNELFVLEFIRQRMKQRGVEKYHFEPYYLEAGKDAIFLRAHNVVYFLVNPPTNVEIDADNAYFNLSTGNIDKSNIAEFTGTIGLKCLDDETKVLLKFIRVIIEKP